MPENTIFKTCSFYNKTTINNTRNSLHLIGGLSSLPYFNSCVYCREGRLEVVLYLVGVANCDSSAQSNDGRTPLHWACQ